MGWDFFGLFSKKDQDVEQIDNKSVNENNNNLRAEREHIDNFVNNVNSINSDTNYGQLCKQLSKLINEMYKNRKSKKSKFYDLISRKINSITKALEDESKTTQNHALYALSRFSARFSTWNREVRNSVKKLYELHTKNLKEKVKDEKEEINDVVEKLDDCDGSEESIKSCCKELYNLIFALFSLRISSRSKFKDSVEEKRILDCSEIIKIIKEENLNNDLSADDIENIKQWIGKVQEIKTGYFSSWGKNIKDAVNTFAGRVDEFKPNKENEYENDEDENNENEENKNDENINNEDKNAGPKNGNSLKVENLKKVIEKSDVDNLNLNKEDLEDKKIKCENIEGERYDKSGFKSNISEKAKIGDKFEIKKENNNPQNADDENKSENKPEAKEDLDAKQKRMRSKVKKSLCWISVLSNIMKPPNLESISKPQKASFRMLKGQLENNLAPNITLSFLYDGKTNYTEKLDENSVQETDSTLEFKYEGRDYKFVFEKYDTSENMKVKIKWTSDKGKEITNDLSYLVPYFPEVFGIKKSDTQKNAQPKLGDKSDNLEKKHSEAITSENLDEKRKKLKESIKGKNELLYKVCEEIVKKPALKMSLWKDSFGKLLVSIFTTDEPEILKKITTVSETPIGTTIEYEEEFGKKTQVSVSLRCCENKNYDSKNSKPYSEELAKTNNIFIFLNNGEAVFAQNISILKKTLGIKSEVNSDKQNSKSGNNSPKNEPKLNPNLELKPDLKSVKQNKMREHIIDILNSKQKLADFKIGIEVLKAPENWKKPSSKDSPFAKSQENLRKQIEQIKDKPIIKALLSIFNTKDNDSINQISEAKFEGSGFVLVMQNKEELKIGFGAAVYFEIDPAGGVFLDPTFLNEKKVKEIKQNIQEEKKEKQNKLKEMEAKKKKEENEKKAQEEARKAEEELKKSKENYTKLVMDKLKETSIKFEDGKFNVYTNDEMITVQKALLGAAIGDDGKVGKILENIGKYIQYSSQDNPLSKVIFKQKLALNEHNEDIKKIKEEKEKEKEKIELIKNLFVGPNLETYKKINLKESYFEDKPEGRTLYLSIQGTGTLRINVGPLSKDHVAQGLLVTAIGLF